MVLWFLSDHDVNFSLVFDNNLDHVVSVLTLLLVHNGLNLPTLNILHVLMCDLIITKEFVKSNQLTSVSIFL